MIEKNTTSIMIVTRGINDTKRSTYPALRNNHHLRHQIARKIGQLLKHRHQAHENRKCACCAIVVETKLKLVLNCKRRNGFAPQLARYVSLTNKYYHTIYRSDKQYIVKAMGSTKVAPTEVALNKEAS